MADWRLPEAERLDWWPSHVRKAFANLGQALDSAQLNPVILAHVSSEGLPGHQIKFSHESGKVLGGRKGMYALEIEGPVYAGSGAFHQAFWRSLRVTQLAVRRRCCALTA